jgi:glycerol-3-phosphate acyltransferase PlsX
MDPEVYGGAPMLGFKGVVLKAHASARERAVASAIRVTTQTIKNQINQMIAREMAAANVVLDAAKSAPKTGAETDSEADSNS